MRGLYPIVDLDTLERQGVSVLAFAEGVLRAYPPLLQLRAKRAPARTTLELLRTLAPLCRRTNTLLFANDRPDLARLAGVDGVHVGQDDLPLEAVRRFAPELRVGISTHDLEQLERALEQTPDYVAFGPVFATRSKTHPDPVVGLEGLATAAARASARGIPLVAIGGIDLERAAAVGRLAPVAAVIGALLGNSVEGIARRASELQAALTATLVTPREA